MESYHHWEHQDWWLPPVMDAHDYAPGRVAIRSVYGGALMPHEMRGASLVNHMGRVCDSRRGWGPYADMIDLLELPPAQRREVAGQEACGALWSE